jgi:hypothetical protein
VETKRKVHFFRTIPGRRSPLLFFLTKVDLQTLGGEFGGVVGLTV